LGTPVKPKKRHPRQGPRYFKTRKGTNIRKGKSQSPTKDPIIIDKSPSKKEEVGPSEGKIEEVIPPKKKTKSPVAFVGRPITRLVTFKKPRTQDSFEQEEEEKL